MARFVAPTIFLLISLATPLTANAAFPPIVCWTAEVGGLGSGKIQCLTPVGVHDVVTGLDFPFGLAIDSANKKIYWTEQVTFGSGRIQRSNLDGTSIESLVTNLDGPVGMALDVPNDRIYWADRDKICNSTLAGSGVNCPTVAGLPRDVALDLTNQKIYWTAESAAKIQRSDLNGTSVEDVITSGLSVPDGIELNVLANQVVAYWSNEGMDKIELTTITESPFTVSGRTDLVMTGTNPEGLAIDPIPAKLYWVDHGEGTLNRINLNGTGAELDLVPAGITKPRRVALLTAVMPVYVPAMSTGSRMVLAVAMFASLLTLRRVLRKQRRLSV